MTNTDFSCVVTVVLYSFSEAASSYDEYGSVSCAIIGSTGTRHTYKLGCYRDNKYICTANITPSNDAGAHVSRDAAYVTFRDDASHYWSLQFTSEDGAIEFCAQVAVAMFGAAGEPKDNVLACDVALGKENKQVFVGDLVKAFYRVWVVQCDDARKDLPRLGSLLEKESEDAVKFAAPANHQGVTATMRGFEGMTIGMRESGQRVIVVPVKAKRGRGPNVSMCFYMEVTRRKDQSATSKSSTGRKAQSAGQQLCATAGGGGDGTNGGGSGAQPLAISACAGDSYSAAAANGFSKDQFLLVDRLRDQVFTLNEQLRDTRRELDNVSADLKRHQRQTGKQTLTSAQIEYSIEQLLLQSETKKSVLEDKRVLLGEAEAGNRELEIRLAKLHQTIKVLADEAQAAANDAAGEQIELDRQLADTQGKIMRLDTELGDATRHMQALKNMIRANELHMREEKTQLATSTNEHHVNEEKLRTLQDSYAEESTRRKLLESKLLTLQEELRRLQDETQLKETLTHQIKAKMESDTTHYTQLIEQEREQATVEFRQLKQDLLEELNARSRQYEEAKARVAEEAYEQGVAQGIEEGLTDAANEGDVIAHDMAVNAQRCKAEAAALQVRLQAGKTANEADERRLRSQLESLEGALARTLQENNSLSTQVAVAQAEHAGKVGALYQRLSRFIHSCTAVPISQPCLAAMMKAAETGGDFDSFTFQQVEGVTEGQQRKEERVAVAAWVRASVYNQPTRLPPLRPPFPCAPGSKGPMLEAAATGSKVLLSTGMERRPPTSALPRPLPLPNASPATSTASPLPPPPEAILAPGTYEPYPDIPFCPPGGGSWGRVESDSDSPSPNSRVHFPSKKIRYHLPVDEGEEEQAATMADSPAPADGASQ